MSPKNLAILALMLFVACAPASNEGRATKDEGRTTNVLVTVTSVPTWTATPAPTATPTVTATPTLTPTRTLTAAESRAASLRPLAGFSWKADGDSVKLYNAQNQAVAVLDQKTGAIRWHNSGDQKHFVAIEPYLGANYQNRKELAKWLSDLKAQGVHFITFADSREGFPPYIVIPTADGNDVQMISSRKGTADFVYNADAKKVMAVFPDKSGYYFVNPDGSFDLAPLQQQAETIANDLLKRGVIQHPVPAKVEIIRDAVVKAIMINPYGATPKEINDFIKSRTGKDFAKHFDETWGNIVGVTYEDLMAATLAKSPSELFAHLYYIGQNTDPDCKTTCWAVLSGKNYIFIVEQDISANAYYPLPITLVKEAYGSKSRNEARARAIAAGKRNEISQESRGAHIGEAISFAIQALVEYQQHRPDSDVNESIRYAFEGGIVY